jgi:hypothetical protein
METLGSTPHLATGRLRRIALASNDDDNAKAALVSDAQGQWKAKST